MDHNVTPKPMQPHATGVPDDFVDPNHPQFPHDPEAQLPERPYKYVPFMSKKSTRIAMVVIFVLLSYVAAVIVGGKVGMGLAKRPDNETVYTTMTVFATTIVPEPKPTIPANICAWVRTKSYVANLEQCSKDCSAFSGPNKTASCKFDSLFKLRCEVCEIDSKIATATVQPTTVFITKTVEAPQPAPTCSFVGGKTFVNDAECNKECNNYKTGSKISSCKIDPSGKLGCEICDHSNKSAKTDESPTKVLSIIPPNARSQPPSATPESPSPSPANSSPPPPPSPAPTPEPKKGPAECFWTGRWSTKEECDEQCEKMDDNSTDEKPVCNLERGFYQCRTCKARTV